MTDDVGEKIAAGTQLEEDVTTKVIMCGILGLLRGTLLTQNYCHVSLPRRG